MSKLFLYIDTSSTDSCILLFNSNQILAQKTNHQQNLHAQTINLLIEEVMKEANIQFSQLDALCVLNGPGSYTGLRISLASAKGICYAANKPLLLLNKLDLIHHSIDSAYAGVSGAVIKARQDEYFCSFYSKDGNVIISDALYSKQELLEENEKKNAVLFGFDVQLASDFRLIHILPIQPEIIQTVCKLCFERQNFADLFLSEPFYLKKTYVNKINKL